MKINDNIELYANKKMNNKSSTNGNDEFIFPNKWNLLPSDKLNKRYLYLVIRQKKIMLKYLKE